MTADTRFDRDLAAVLDDLYLGPSPDYKREAIAVATHRRQRPRWTFLHRWLPMTDSMAAQVAAPVRWRTIGVAILILALVLAAVAAVAGSHRTRVPSPFGPAGNGQILYPSNGDVYALDRVTGAKTLLAGGVSNDLDALFSPDGMRIAYSRLSENVTPATLTIVVADADGSHPTVVTKTPLQADGLHFVWAPDSRTLYIQTGLFGTGPLTTMQLDTTSATEPTLIATGAELVPQPARPPDGRQLLLRRQAGAFAQITLLDLATRKEQVIASGNEKEVGLAAWSNDGTRIAYSAPSRDGTGSAIWIVNGDLSDPHQVVDEPGTWMDNDPVWSPDDRRIAFTRWHRTSPDGASKEVWDIAPIGLLDVAAGTVTPIGPIARDVRRDHPSPHDPDATPRERLAFDWSPDGSVLLAVPTDATGHPVLIDPDTRTYTVLDTLFDEQGGAMQLWQRTAD